MEEPVDPLLIEQGDQAPDTLLPVVLPVAIVEHDADGIDEEETAGREQHKAEIPFGVGDDNGQDGGHIDPYEGEEERLADGDMLQLPEHALRELGGGIQEGKEGADTKGEEIMPEIEEINGSSYGAGEIKNKMQGLVPVGPLHPAGRTGAFRRKIPVEIIAAD